MASTFATLVACLGTRHDPGLLALAAAVCTAGIYASFAIAHHAARSHRHARLVWGFVSVLASGCTAWATHFLCLLAYMPGTRSAFDPALTFLSLLCAIVGVGLGITCAIRSERPSRHFAAGMIIGCGVAALHYVGQSAYLVQGRPSWNLQLVVGTVVASLPLFGCAVTAAASRSRAARHGAAPILIGSIALLHFGGMTALRIEPDRAIPLAANAIPSSTMAPFVASLSVGLLALAVMGWRLDLIARARLRNDRRRLRQLADVALEGLLICRADEVLTANDAIERLAGYDPQALSGTLVRTMLPDLDIGAMRESEEHEAHLIRADGTSVPVRALRRDVELGATSHMVIAVRDQRERLQTEERIRNLAFSDHLTGLPNRARFFEVLKLETAAQDNSGRCYAVIMIDLDRFKPVNDTLGHAAGDSILTMVAQRLLSSKRDGDVVARLGGDEFAVLAPCCEDLEDAVRLASRLVDAICDSPFVHAGHSIHLGACAGISRSRVHGRDAVELMRKADVALYAAKDDGRGTHRVYDCALSNEMRHRLELEEGLRAALRGNQLELRFQPILDPSSGRITFAEALVRWRHPDRGLVSPADFIPVAEETGLIVVLGQWVLERACLAAAAWPQAVGVAVNLSPAQIRDPLLVAKVSGALAQAGLAPGRLELEVTESVLLDDEGLALSTLQRLRQMGIRIALDDFGTGYSALSYLQKYPFDRVKIDQVFMRRVPADPQSAAIVRGIISIVGSLGMKTTAEGVETMEQFRFATSEGCESVQGFLVSEPLAEGDIAAFLLHNSWPVEPTPCPLQDRRDKAA